jgi:chromosome segregation ATPase
MMSFLRNLVGVKTDQAVNAGLEALVRWDPQSATEAELQTMEQHLDALGQEVARARQSFDKEKRESEAIAQLSQQRMAAAEQLQQQMAAESDPTRKAALEKSLGTLVGMLEQMQPDIEREARDAKDAEEFLQSLESAYADAGGKLKAARSELDRAHRQMSRAEQQRDMAERQAESARRAAGLASTTSSLGLALKAMQDAADKDLATAEAARAKAKLLTPTRPEQDDPNIAAALANASGKTAPTADLGARLAALKAGRS